MTESLILKKLMQDKKFFATVYSDLLYTDFEKPENQAIFGSIVELYNTYRKQPSIDELEIYIDSTSKLKVNLKTLMRESIKELRTLGESVSDEILIDMAEKFVKNKRFKDMLIKGVEVLDGSSKKDSIESLAEESNNIRKLSFKKSAGLDYIRDAEKNFLEYGQVEEVGIKAPLEIINLATSGGFRPGSLTIIAAVSNMGKTIFITNLAGYAALQGKNVAIFHMEETELDIRERLDAYLMGKPTTEIRRLSSELKTPFEHLVSKGFGNIKIKSYGPNSASCTNYQAQLDEWRLQDGFIPDLIVHDSITITKPSSNVDNLYGKGKAVSEELKAIGVHNNIPVISAVQLGRCLDLYTEVIEETKGRIFIKDIEVGDNVLSNNGYRKVIYKFPIEKTKRYKIKTKSGKEIICSEKHLFPTNEGELNIENGLVVGKKLWVR